MISLSDENDVPLLETIEAVSTGEPVITGAGHVSSKHFRNSTLGRLLESVLLHQCVAELLGTMVIVGIGLTTVSASTIVGAHKGLFQVAVSWGLVVAIAICSFGSVSGAHFNPAMSLAFALFKPCEFQRRKLAPYIVAQFLGAFLGALMNYICYAPFIADFERRNNINRSSVDGKRTAMIFGEFSPAPDVAHAVELSSIHAALVECLATSILSFVVFSSVDARNNVLPKGGVPFFIGATICVLVSAFAPITQVGLNPARDFSPRIVAWLCGWSLDVSFERFWVYFVGPIVGAVVGAGTYELTVARSLKLQNK